MRVRGTIRDQCVTDRSNGRDTNLHEGWPRHNAVVTRARHDPSARRRAQATRLAIVRAEVRRAGPAADRFSHIVESPDQVGRVEVVQLRWAVRRLVHRKRHAKCRPRPECGDTGRHDVESVLREHERCTHIVRQRVPDEIQRVERIPPEETTSATMRARGFFRSAITPPDASSMKTRSLWKTPRGHRR